MNGVKMIKKILVAVLSTILIVATATSALAQPIDYGTYQNVKTFNATVSGDTATVSNISGEAGDTIEILIPLVVGGNVTLARVYIILKGPVSNASFTIKNISTPSINPPDGAFSFFNVDTNIDPSAVSSVDFIFNTPNNIDNVQLDRAVGGNWTPLPTVSLGIEGDIEWYKATSPGFSEFSIVGTKGAAKAGGKLPFTSGLPLYITGALGLLLIASGIALRLKAR